MRLLTEYEVWTILHTEREDAIMEEQLDEDEIDEYLLVLEAEIHQTWTILDYYTYWQNYVDIY